MQGKNGKIGKHGVMKLGTEIYRSNCGRFIIIAYPGNRRPYSTYEHMNNNLLNHIKEYDRIFKIQTNGEYQYTTVDIGKMAFEIIANKQSSTAARNEAKGIKEYIDNALNEVDNRWKLL